MRTREYVQEGEGQVDAMNDGHGGMQTFDGELEKMVRPAH